MEMREMVENLTNYINALSKMQYYNSVKEQITTRQNSEAEKIQIAIRNQVL